MAEPAKQRERLPTRESVRSNWESVQIKRLKTEADILMLESPRSLLKTVRFAYSSGDIGSEDRRVH